MWSKKEKEKETLSLNLIKLIELNLNDLNNWILIC